MAAKVAKIEIFPLSTGYSCTTLRVKNSLKIALSLTASEVFSMFYFLLKSKMDPKCRKLKFFPLAQDTLVLPCGSEIHSKSLYLLRFSRYLQFLFSAKIKDGHRKWRKIETFSPKYRIPLYYSTDQKFSRNRSICYGFQDNYNFLYTAKIQDGCKSGKKLKIFP